MFAMKYIMQNTNTQKTNQKKRRERNMCNGIYRIHMLKALLIIVPNMATDPDQAGLEQATYSAYERLILYHKQY